MKAVEARNLSFAYEGGQQVLDRLNFDIELGEILVIAGLSGCGKTTLCHILCGIIPHGLPGKLDGQIKVLGKEARQVSLAKMAAQVGLVFQDSDNQIVCTTVEDELAFGLENLCIEPEEIRQRVDDALIHYGFSGRGRLNPSKLSGGQKKLLTIAGVLMLNPEILILDEPMSHLDAEGREIVRQAIQSQHRQGRTIIMVEHDLKLVTYADRWLILREGALAALDTAQHLMNDPDKLRTWDLMLSDSAEDSRLCKRQDECSHSLIQRQLQFPAEPNKTSGECVRRSEEEGCSHGRTPRSTPSGVLKITLEQVSYRYPHAKKEIITDFSGSFGRGEIVALSGKNGCGKTTLTKLIVGILCPDRGCISIDGADTQGMDLFEIGKHVGYVFQNPNNQLFCETVYQELAYGLINMGLTETEIKQKVGYYLNYFRLEHHKEDYPGKLSHGEKQRVALAAILAIGPHYVILDEPTTGLDIRGRHSLGHILTEMKRDHQTGIIMVSHEPDFIQSYADRELVMV
jgi:energy-coupling factor transport system ATP-binding protein